MLRFSRAKMLSGFFRFSAAQLREPLQYLRAAASAYAYKEIKAFTMPRFHFGFYLLCNALLYVAILFPMVLYNPL